MATIYSDIGTKQNASGIRNRADGDLVAGRMAFVPCRYTTNGSTAAADVLRLVHLPKGAIVVPGLSFIDTEDCGTGISIKIGDNDTTADDDRYTTAISLASAGRIAFTGGVAGPNPFTLTSDCWVQGVIVDAGSIAVTSGQDFTVWIAYIIP